MYRLIALAALFFAVTAAVFGQARLPRGFDGIDLGLPLADVKDLLLKNGYFAYRGDPDVSFLPKRKEVVIDTDGGAFIRRALFQFHEDRLYTITLYLEPLRMDYFSLYTHAIEKYGPPTDFRPEFSMWEDGTVRYILEKPLTVKYIYLPVFDMLRGRSAAERSFREISRDEFLKLF